jgi:hypothetical protein
MGWELQESYRGKHFASQQDWYGHILELLSSFFSFLINSVQSKYVTKRSKADDILGVGSYPNEWSHQWPRSVWTDDILEVKLRCVVGFYPKRN